LVKIKNKYSVRDCEVIFLLIYMGFVFLIYWKICLFRKWPGNIGFL
jgi:hypothetical protein